MRPPNSKQTKRYTAEKTSWWFSSCCPFQVARGTHQVHGNSHGQLRELRALMRDKRRIWCTRPATLTKVHHTLEILDGLSGRAGPDLRPLLHLRYQGRPSCTPSISLLLVSPPQVIQYPTGAKTTQPPLAILSAKIQILATLRNRE